MSHSSASITTPSATASETAAERPPKENNKMEPLLTNASISFHTNDEDKDDDTHVTITVRDENDTTAARVDSNFSRFPDHSDAGPYPLQIRSSSGKSVLQRGSITIRVDPNGHDTWRFNWELDLHFSHGSHLGAAVTGSQLSQNARQDTWGLQGIIRPSRL